jgi:hypothetical protein
VEARYPGTLPSKEEAQGAVKIARNLRRFEKNIVGILNLKPK